MFQIETPSNLFQSNGLEFEGLVPLTSPTLLYLCREKEFISEMFPRDSFIACHFTKEKKRRNNAKDEEKKGQRCCAKLQLTQKVT